MQLRSATGFASASIAFGAPINDAAAPTPARAAAPRPGNPIANALFATAGATSAPINANALNAALTLPGPIGPMLQRGVPAPTALAAQVVFETAILGGENPLTGDEMSPVWIRWGLDSAKALDALAVRLTGMSAGVEALAQMPAPPSQVASLLLGQQPGPLPPMALDPHHVEAAMLSLGSPAGIPGLNGLVRITEPPVQLGGAAALTAVGVAAGLGLSLLHFSVPPQAGAVPLGAGLAVAAQPGGSVVPPSATVMWSGLNPDPALQSPSNYAAVVLMGVAQSVMRSVAEGGSPPLSVAVNVPLDGSPVSGNIVLASGQSVPTGIPVGLPGATVSWGSGESPRKIVGAALVLGNAPGESNGALEVLGVHVNYEERPAIPLDLAPARPKSPVWRIDDTSVRVAVGSDGIGSALKTAQRLYARLQSGKLALDEIAPGQGIETWEGSPAWLGLAGVAKPASVGVLPGEASPPRFSLHRSPAGGWLLVRQAGSEGRRTRQAYAAEAAEDIGFYNDVVFGLLHGTDRAPPGGLAGETAARGFREARAAMAQSGMNALSTARQAEAWGLVARVWAGVLERLARTGAGRITSHGEADVLAGMLREIAGWSGSAPAWSAARQARLEPAYLLSALGDYQHASLANALAPGGAMHVAMGWETPRRSEAAESWSATARLVATSDPDALREWGREALDHVLQGQPETLTWAAAVAIATFLEHLVDRRPSHAFGAQAGSFQAAEFAR